MYQKTRLEDTYLLYFQHRDRRVGGERTNQAILHNFSTTSSLLEHGVSESFGRATEVGLVSDFGCLADGRPEPRHLFCLCLLPISLSLSRNDNKKLFLLRRLPDGARRDLRDQSSLQRRSRLLIPFPLLALSTIVLVCRHT
jgi:hypothetical protein